MFKKEALAVMIPIIVIVAIGWLAGLFLPLFAR